jgi:hypothetical protein
MAVVLRYYFSNRQIGIKMMLAFRKTKVRNLATGCFLDKIFRHSVAYGIRKAFGGYKDFATLWLQCDGAFTYTISIPPCCGLMRCNAIGFFKYFATLWLNEV